MNERNSNPTSNTSDLADMLNDLGGGVFAQKIERALSDVALGVVTHGDKGKAGEVTVTFTMKRIGESNQVTLDHKVAFSQPTLRGKKTEQDTTQTPLHVGPRGKLTLMPDTQTGFEFTGERGGRDGG